MDPSSATTQRGARVGTSSASLILPQASGFGRFAAPPSSSANATLVCLGTAPAGPFFTDSRWINPVRRWKRLSGLGLGENPKRGPQPPHWSLRGGWSLGGGHSRKCPPPKCPFGYFSDKRKVTRGTGPEAPKGFGKKHVSFPPARRWANLSASVPCVGTDYQQKRIKYSS